MSENLYLRLPFLAPFEAHLLNLKCRTESLQVEHLSLLCHPFVPPVKAGKLETLLQIIIEKDRVVPKYK